jgi:hypothetical protein
MTSMTATLAPAPHGYVWSRWTARPVEHVADGTPSAQPICGAPLAPERQYTAETPSGLAPLCARCQRRAARLPLDRLDGHVIAPASWSTDGPREIAPGQTVVRWTHPGGGIVDDNSRNVPADLDDLTPDELAEMAYVGHYGTGWEQFATFAAAARYATGGGLS